VVERATVELPFLVIESDRRSPLVPRHSLPILLESPVYVSIEEADGSPPPAEPSKECEVHERPHREMMRFRESRRHRRRLAVCEGEPGALAKLRVDGSDGTPPLGGGAVDDANIMIELAESLQHPIRADLASRFTFGCDRQRVMEDDR
jgi:hypothetical protein